MEEYWTRKDKADRGWRLEKYWKRKDKADLLKARTFTRLCKIALRVIRRMPKPVGEVCGPITSGGYGNKKQNVRAFKATIKKLIVQGNNIFNQMPFEDSMERILRTPVFRGGDQLLVEFYLPIFESRLITTFYFMANWKTSVGARWEHRQAKRLKIPIVYLPEDFS